MNYILSPLFLPFHPDFRAEVSKLWPTSQTQLTTYFVNKALLAHGHDYAYTQCLWLPPDKPELNDCDRKPGPEKLSILHNSLWTVFQALLMSISLVLCLYGQCCRPC